MNEPLPQFYFCPNCKMIVTEPECPLCTETATEPVRMENEK